MFPPTNVPIHYHNIRSHALKNCSSSSHDNPDRFLNRYLLEVFQ